MLADGLGSSRTEMVNGAVQTATTYEPYGKVLAQTGSSGTVYGFTGEQYDALTSLVYLRARYYNPSLKVFMSKDPFPGYVTLPSSQHGYSYSYNNPVNLTDPSGETPIPLAAGCMIPGVGIACATAVAIVGVVVAVVVIGALIYDQLTNGACTNVWNTFPTQTQTRQQEANLERFEEFVNGNPKMDPEQIQEVDFPPLDVRVTVVPPDDDKYVTFYTVQGPEDAIRLRTTGHPWPSDPFRAALGEGVYSWALKKEAQEYLAHLNRNGLANLEIMTFRIRVDDLSQFHSLNVDSLPDPEKWMSQYSLIWGGIPNHGYQYIQRGTQIGTEHYFHKSVFHKLHFE